MNLKHPSGVLLSELNDLIALYYDGADLRLYSNNVTPSEISVIGDFTECTFTGYASQSMTPWSTSYLPGILSAEGLSPPRTFTCTAGGPQNVYGVFVTVSGALLYAQRLDALIAPFAIAAGLSFTYTPRILLRNIP